MLRKRLGDHRSSCKIGGQLLLETANDANVGHQSHKKWQKWRQNPPSTRKLMIS